MPNCLAEDITLIVIIVEIKKKSLSEYYYKFNNMCLK